MADNETSIKKPPFYIRRFFLILVLLGFLGGFLALTVPLWKSWTYVPFLSSLIPANSADYSESKAIADLRLHILYITGGIIAILTLLQTDWKNQIDHRKVEDDIQKNKNDHNRQVHAERRSRYTTAVEQLANEKAAVRLGGIYTLVGLVDEWIADDSLEPDEQQEEGQIIINNLCAYVRSPFTLAESREVIEASTSPYVYSGNLKEDKARLREEQDVRRAIFDEISKRRSKISTDKNKKSSIIPSAWNNFIFDFSGAPIFYSLNNLTIEKANFTLANFYGEANFFKTTFIQNAHFDEVTFTQNANFSEAKFIQNVTFSKATFTQNTDFSKATFTQDANFSEAKFVQNMAFTRNTNFSEAKFIQNANFSKANFSKANFIRVTFTQCANFSKAAFAQNATFSKASFKQNANFSEAAFAQNITFSKATFAKNADFSKATFAQNATFGKVTFAQNVTFKKATFKKQVPTFAQGSYRARFSVRVNPKNRSFTTNLFIPLGKAILGGVEYFIPVGTVLYDPDSWDKEKQDYTTHSQPAKLANYSNQGKNKTE